MLEEHNVHVFAAARNLLLPMVGCVRALCTLRSKVKEVSDDKNCQGIFAFAAIHGVVYQGPNYGVEMRDALDSIDAFVAACESAGIASTDKEG